MYHVYKPVASFPGRSMHLNRLSYVEEAIMIISTVELRYNREPVDRQNLFAIQCNPGTKRLYVTTASPARYNERFCLQPQ